MDISVVIPLYNEEESLSELVDWIRRVMEDHSFSYEVLLVDNYKNINKYESKNITYDVLGNRPVIQPYWNNRIRVYQSFDFKV